MKKAWSLACVALVGLLLAFDAREESILHHANRAMLEQRYADALSEYAKIEVSATDPGLIAYNKGLALYHLKQYADAARHFRCALEGASAERQCLAQYALGNALLQRSLGEDVGMLQQAIDTYRVCLNSNEVKQLQLTKSLHNNLALAKLLLISAQARQNKQTPEQGTDKKQENGSKNNTKDESQKSDKNGSPNGEKDKKENPKEGQQGKINETDEQSPGKGRLEVLSDNDSLTPIMPEDVQRYLQQALQRIEMERRNRWKMGDATPGHIKNW